MIDLPAIRARLETELSQNDNAKYDNILRACLNDIPALLDEIERLRKELHDLEEQHRTENRERSGK